MAGSALTGRNIMTRLIIVKKDQLMTAGETYTFRADHWHEYADGTLEIVDHWGETVGSFRSGKWDHVYYEDSVVDIKERIK